MTKLRDIVRQVKYSRYTDKRFYTSVDMAEIKRYEAVRNSQEKRGEIKRTANQYICRCGCGWEGCFIHGHSDTVTQEEKNLHHERMMTERKEDVERAKNWKSKQGKRSKEESKRKALLKSFRGY